MMNDNDLEEKRLLEETKRGQAADKLLANPLLKQWFMERKASLFGSFCHSKADDTDTRQLIWLKMQILNELEGDLQEFVDSGKMATSQLKEFFKRFI